MLRGWADGVADATTHTLSSFIVVAARLFVSHDRAVDRASDAAVAAAFRFVCFSTPHNESIARTPTLTASSFRGRCTLRSK